MRYISLRNERLRLPMFATSRNFLGAFLGAFSNQRIAVDGRLRQWR